MQEVIHIFDKSGKYTRCGFSINNLSMANSVEECTCKACLKFIMRDALNRFLLLDSR
jgi:hypothetical protein